MTEQEQLHAQEEPLSLPRQVVDMIMSTLQSGTAKEIAERNMSDRWIYPRCCRMSIRQIGVKERRAI